MIFLIKAAFCSAVIFVCMTVIIICGIWLEVTLAASTNPLIFGAFVFACFSVLLGAAIARGEA